METQNLKSKMASGVVWNFGERFLAKGVSFIVTIILARILTTEDFGVVAMINVFIAIADTLVSNGLSTAIIQNKQAGQKEFSTVFFVNLLFSLVLYALLFFAAPLISNFYEVDMTLLIRIFGLKLIVSSFQSVLIAIVSRRMIFKKFFFATLIGTLVSAVVGIVMAINGFGVWALITQYLTNTVIDTIILFFTVGWKPSFYMNIKESKPLLKFGFQIMGSNLVGTTFNQLNSLIIGKKYTSSDLGYYDQGRRIPNLITENVSCAVTSVLFPAMSKAGTKDEIKLIAKKSTQLLSFVLFPLMVGLILVAKPLVSVLLTDKWLPAVPFIQIMCCAGIIEVLDSSNGLQVIKATGHSGTYLKLEFIKKPIFLLITFVSIQFGVTAIALTVLINAFLAMIINTTCASKYSGYNLFEQLGDCFSAFWMVVIMGAAVYLCGLLPVSPYIVLAVQVVVGAIVYIGAAALSKNSMFIMLLEKLKTILHVKRKDKDIKGE